MKCLLVSYINGRENIDLLDGILGYYELKPIEQNGCHRVYEGDYKGHALSLAERLKAELEGVDLHMEDSIFITYPQQASGQPTLSNIIIKRKGNKELRRQRMIR